jgi:hypothetical protein
METGRFRIARHQPSSRITVRLIVMQISLAGKGKRIPEKIGKA